MKKIFFLTIGLLVFFTNLNVSAETLIPVKKEGKWGYINSKADIIIPIKYDEVGTFIGGIAPVWANKKCQYIKEDGSFLTDDLFESGGNFDNGVTIVSKDRKKYVLNDKGELTPLRYNNIGRTYDFYYGLCGIVSNGKLGYINTKGDLVIPFKYDEIPGLWEGFDKNGYAKVIKNDHSGVIDRQGNEVIPCQYESVSRVDLSKNLWKITKNGKTGIINVKTNKFIIPIECQEIYLFNEGISRIRRNGKWQFINEFGQVIYTCSEGMPDAMVEGMARVSQNWKNWKSGFINKSGQLVIPCKYQDASHFSNGVVKVKYNNKYGFINKQGETVIPFKFDNVDDFSNGMAKLTQNEKVGFINLKGNIIIPCNYEDGARFNSQGVTKIRKNGKWGLIDRDGKIILTCEYEDIRI